MAETVSLGWHWSDRVWCCYGFLDSQYIGESVRALTGCVLRRRDSGSSDLEFSVKQDEQYQLSVLLGSWAKIHPSVYLAVRFEHT